MRVLIVAVVLIALCRAVVLSQPAGDATRPVRRVLMVFSDDRLLPANQQVDDALRQALRAAPFTLSYYSEFLDAARFPSGEHNEATRTYLTRKYRDQPPDVVVVAARTALEFFLEARERFFPGVPIVHLALSADEVAAGNQDPTVVGITGAWELRRSLDLARQLQPARTNVFVINGASMREASGLRRFREAAAADFPGMRFTWLVEQSVPQLETAVQRLPPDALILYNMLYQDAGGQFYVPRDVVERLSLVANAPIYGPFESYIGHGIVGGTMETWRTAGATAGGLVVRILGGMSPQAAAAGVRMPLTTIVDWRQVKRWGIDPARLPAGTEARFRQPTLWEAYRTQVIIAAVVGVAQLFLIATLAVALRRRRVAEATRRQAEAKAVRLRTELAHAGRVTLLGELAATLAHELNQPLAAILSNAQATRRWLKSDQPNLPEVLATVEDIIADDKRAGEIIHRMRGLLKKEERARTPVDVGKAVTDVANLVHGALIAANVKLQLSLPPAPVLVDGNEIEIQQVLLNLMTNGIQSIQESAPPTREVRVEARSQDGYVVVAVHDTGRGVPPDLRERLFEPFFTTKTRGLGVGLNVCRRIAEAHGGRLDLAESPLGGATFEFALPAATAS